MCLMGNGCITMTRSQKIVQHIEAGLAEGDYGRVGDRFITVRQLALRFGVSLVTAQRIMKQLKQQGLLVGDSTHAPKISLKAVRSVGREQGAPRRLGMVVTNIASPFFSQLCRHVQQEGAATGYQVLTAASQYDFKREKKAVESFLEIGVQGLLVVPSLDPLAGGFYRQLAERGVRMVFVSRFLDDVGADYVVADSFLGSAAVAGHFVSMAYDSFGYIGFASQLTRDARLSGFRSALWEGGVTLDAEQIVNAEGGKIEDGFRAMAKLMQAKSRPRAVFAYHDLLALGALQYCQEHGISVPDEVAIAGFDNLPQSQVTRPALTTVSYPIESMARLAVNCATERRAGEAAPRPHHRILLAPQLLVRRSSDPKAAPVGAAASAGYRVGELL